LSKYLKKHKLIYGIINKVIRFSAVDGPGNRMVVFFQGCNFDCAYCHNPETINYCNNCGECIDVCTPGALFMIENQVIWDGEICINCGKCIVACPHNSTPKETKASADDIINLAVQNRKFISGITISGGECTIQYDFLLELLKFAKQRKISVFIDTNAYLPTKQLEELSLYFDKAMPDIKAFDNNEHINLTGKSSDLVLKNVEFLLKNNKVHEIRTVIYPNLLNYEQTVDDVSKLIVRYDRNVIYKLIKYRREGTRPARYTNEPADELMLVLQLIAQKNGCLNVVTV